MFGLLPRTPLPYSGEEVEVVEVVGVAAILTLRSLLSILFHHPGTFITLVRSPVSRVAREEEEELAEHLATLQEAGYRVQDRTGRVSQTHNVRRIQSNTILDSSMPGEAREHWLRDTLVKLFDELKACTKTSLPLLKNKVAAKMEVNFAVLKNLSNNTICKIIFNEFCILSSISSIL